MTRTRPRPAPHALSGMSEAARPTGPVAGIIVSLVIMLVGQLPFAPFLPHDTSGFTGQLVLTGTFLAPMLLFFAWVRFKEKRPVASLGFRGAAAGQLLLGAVIALVLTGLTVAINVLSGSASLGHPTRTAALPALILLIGFAIQSSTEEIADRGYLMQAVAPRWGLVAAIIVQTLAFAALHGLNGGLTWVAWSNLCAVAVFLSLWVWVSGSLWGACAFHTVWNWSQGNLWGAPVSHQVVSTSIGHYSPAQSAPAIITGGPFGLEGSIIPLCGFIVGSAVLIVIGRRRGARRS